MRNNEERIGARNVTNTEAASLESLTTNNKPSLDLNFVIPTELVDLPSKGRFYSPEHPLHGRDTIEIRQMTAKEEDILTSRSLLKKGIALDKLIQSLVVDKSINPDNLTVEDRSAIVVAARISGYGPEYATTITCPACSEKTKFTFNLLEKLPRDEEEETSIEVSEAGTFFINLPTTKWNVECRAMFGTDEKALARISETKKKLLNDSILLDQLKMIVVSIQGVTDKTVIEKAINAMPAADSRYIRKAYEQVVKGIDMTHSFVCSQCSEQTELEVPLTADFFWFK